METVTQLCRRGSWMSKVAACGVTSVTFHNVCFGVAALKKHIWSRKNGWGRYVSDILS